jgi:hypothetical protein
MTTPLSDRNLSAKYTMDSIKLSTCLFQRGMQEKGSDMCKIERLDGTFAITRLTLLSKETSKKKCL